MTQEDGNLPAALEKFRDAVHQLIAPTPNRENGVTHEGPSRYAQLSYALYGNVAPGGGGGSKSKPPLFIDGLDLLNEIDIAVSIWQTDPHPPAHIAETVWRLQILAARNYRPQDCHQLTQMTDALTYWAERITTLTDPKPIIPLRGYQCPRCQHKKIKIRDSGGEWVWQDILLYEHNVGTTCRNRQCKDDQGRQSFWNMQQSRQLGKLLLNDDQPERARLLQELVDGDIPQEMTA